MRVLQRANELFISKLFMGDFGGERQSKLIFQDQTHPKASTGPISPWLEINETMHAFCF